MKQRELKLTDQASCMCTSDTFCSKKEHPAFTLFSLGKHSFCIDTQLRRGSTHSKTIDGNGDFHTANRSFHS